MPKRLSKRQISEAMAQMGRKGGKVAMERRMKATTPEQRTEAALKAAKARWKKAKRKKAV